MTSPLLAYFGDKPSSLRTAMTLEIVEPLRQGKPGDNTFFTSEKYPPSDAKIRSLRSKAKRRYHIYNYERVNASHLWSGQIFLKGEKASVPLCEYQNDSKMLTINTNHSPILTKTLQSVFAHHWPEVKIGLNTNAHQKPIYPWDWEKVKSETVELMPQLNAMRYFNAGGLGRVTFTNSSRIFFDEWAGTNDEA